LLAQVNSIEGVQIVTDSIDWIDVEVPDHIISDLLRGVTAGPLGLRISCNLLFKAMANRRSISPEFDVRPHFSAAR
jgi:hypothetical protein